MKKTRILDKIEAINIIKNNSTVAIGGFVLKRHPMALIYEIIRQKKKGLTLYGWNNGIDFDLLIASGCVSEIHTAYVGFGALGLAPNFRRAVEKNTIKIIDETESTAQDRFRAGSLGLTFFPTKTPFGSDMRINEEFKKEIKCPFTGENYVALQAWNPDVALIHAHSSDQNGNIRYDKNRFPDTDWDVIIAKSAKQVIVSVEEIIDEKYMYEDPARNLLPSFIVDAVVELPFGAHPCSCDTRYETDIDLIKSYTQYSKNNELGNKFFEHFIFNNEKHFDYLNKIGLKQLMKLQGKREV